MLATLVPGIHVVALAAIALASGWYGQRVGRLRSRGETWPTARTLLYAGAMVVAGVGSVPVLAGFVDRAVQELLLFLVAPILLVLSGPLTLGVQAGGKGAELARRAVTGRLGRFVLHPVAAWVIYGTALLALYFSPEYRFGVAHPDVGLLIDLELVAVGWLLAWPLAGPDPKPREIGIGWRILAVMFATVYFSILGLAMQSEHQPIAPGVTVSAMHAGGGDLWTSAELLTIIATIGLLWQWLFVDLGRAQRADQRNAAEDAAQLAIWRAIRREAGLADLRARDSLIVRSRPSGTERSEEAFGSARAAPPRTPQGPPLPPAGRSGHPDPTEDG
ncbi:MAG: cytochrome c oxidase assembly protein [Actinomycetota bacterium]|nr:cytochrome c oxidase assembly protein [Actinomycetota bacterium]